MLSHSSDLTADDSHTLADKTTLYKTCEPVKRLPKCRYFKEAAWTIFSFPDSNATQQIVNCHCPKNSVTYLLKKLPYTTPTGEQGNQYQFACSPQSVSVGLIRASAAWERFVVLIQLSKHWRVFIFDFLSYNIFTFVFEHKLIQLI